MTAVDAPVPTDPDDLVAAWHLLTGAVTAVSVRLAEGGGAVGDLSLPQLDVLIRLHREPGHRLSMTRLADDVGLTSGGFSKLADRMEHDGLITRENATNGRRTISAALTDRGRALTVVALQDHQDGLRRFLLEPLGPERLETLTDLARVVRDSNRMPLAEA